MDDELRVARREYAASPGEASAQALAQAVSRATVLDLRPTHAVLDMDKGYYACRPVPVAAGEPFRTVAARALFGGRPLDRELDEHEQQELALAERAFLLPAREAEVMLWIADAVGHLGRDSWEEHKHEVLCAWAQAFAVGELKGDDRVPAIGEPVGLTGAWMREVVLRVALRAFRADPNPQTAEALARAAAIGDDHTTPTRGSEPRDVWPVPLAEAPTDVRQLLLFAEPAGSLLALLRRTLGFITDGSQVLFQTLGAMLAVGAKADHPEVCPGCEMSLEGEYEDGEEDPAYCVHCGAEFASFPAAPEPPTPPKPKTKKPQAKTKPGKKTAKTKPGKKTAKTKPGKKTAKKKR